MNRLLIIALAGITLLSGCASAPKEHVVVQVKYVVLGPNEANYQPTPVPPNVSTGCSDKAFNWRACLNSRSYTLNNAYTALGKCNADKVDISKTLEALKEKHGQQ